MIKSDVIIDNKYKIITLAGTGGMSNVYEAYDLINKRTVAFKILKREYVENIEANIRFKNEIEISKKLSHPNIVSYFDSGIYSSLPYVVLEYISKNDLKKSLDLHRYFSISESFNYLCQLLDVVSYIHSHHIVHRDIKSSNIFILNDGALKLGDFGISIDLSSKANINEVRKIPGTVQYLAPELVKGHKPSYQSDIYSIGILLYEMLSGKTPFNGGNTNENTSMQLKSEVPSILKIFPTYPSQLDEIIKKATNKSLPKRYKSCQQFKEEALTFINLYNKGELNKLVTNKRKYKH